MRAFFTPLRLAASLLAMSVVVPAQGPARPSAQPGAWELAGKVISAADGQPLSRAAVTVSSTADRELAQAALTGSDGRFIFHGLAAGKYVLEAQRNGFVAQAYQQHGAFSTAVAVGPGLPPLDLLFRLQPEAAISGTVVDDAGDPVRDAQVLLLHKSLLNGQWATRMGNSVNSDDRGFYHFGRLLPGRYFVAVQAQPWYARTATQFEAGSVGKLQPNSAEVSLDVAYPITYYQDATDAGDATPMDLQPGQRATADITLTAVLAQHIVVRIPDTTQFPRSARLSQQLSDAAAISVSASFQRIAPGVFQSTGVPPGNYGMELRSYNPRTGQQGAEHTTNVEAGKETEIDLTESSAAAPVSGTVRFIPVIKLPAHLAVILLREHSQDMFVARISPQGDFVFERAVPPGDYQVVARSVEGVFIASVSASGAQVVGRTLHISSSAPVAMKVVMSRGLAHVKGTAVRGGKPRSGALVLLVPSDPGNNQPLFRADQSDSDGTFTLPAVVPGKYTLVSIDNGWGLEWRNPSVLQPYLPRGKVLELAPEGRYNINPEVQDF